MKVDIHELLKLRPQVVLAPYQEGDIVNVKLGINNNITYWDDIILGTQDEYVEDLKSFYIAKINADAKEKIFTSVADGRQGEDGLIRQINYLAETVAILISLLPEEQQVLFAPLSNKRNTGMQVKAASDVITADPLTYQGVTDPRWPDVEGA